MADVSPMLAELSSATTRMGQLSVGEGSGSRRLMRSVSSIERRGAELRKIEDLLLKGANLEAPVVPSLFSRGRSSSEKSFRTSDPGGGDTPTRSLGAMRSRSQSVNVRSTPGCIGGSPSTDAESTFVAPANSMGGSPRSKYGYGSRASSVRNSLAAESVREEPEEGHDHDGDSETKPAGSPGPSMLTVEQMSTRSAADSEQSGDSPSSPALDDSPVSSRVQLAPVGRRSRLMRVSLPGDELDGFTPASTPHEASNMQQRQEQISEAGPEAQCQPILQLPDDDSEDEDDLKARPNPWAPLPGPSHVPLSAVHVKVVEEATRSLRTLDSMRMHSPAPPPTPASLTANLG